MSKQLTPEQIESALTGLKGWTFEDDALRKDFRFGSFTEALAFLVQVGFLAEKHNHHPQISNVYNSVSLGLQTHDAGDKVTEKDVELAQAIDGLNPAGLV